MRIVLNGDERQVPAGCNLQELLQSMGWDSRLLAVEINREIVTEPDFSLVELKENDQVEVVHFVGGGSAHVR